MCGLHLGQVLSQSSRQLGSAFVTLTELNNVPTLAAIEDQTASFGELVQFQTDAADLDGDALTSSVSVDGLSAAESQPAINGGW
ncbi:hypothetical protein N9L06_06585 [Mariniblastus sp.]|nr:hypothetical protein [Mariniblastus sp.]